MKDLSVSLRTFCEAQDETTPTYYCMKLPCRYYKNCHGLLACTYPRDADSVEPDDPQLEMLR